MTMIKKGLNCPNKDNGSYEIDTRLSSRPESSHVDSSNLQMPGSILKTVNVHHAATRFVHTIPPLASYYREYLQTRTEMRLLAVLNKQNKKVILTADGINELPHTRRRILRQLQFQAYDDIQLLPCLSLFCTCPLCLDIISCRLAPGCKCSKCSSRASYPA
jgi:hypothetical protein